MATRAFKIDATNAVKDDALSAFLAATVEPALTSIPLVAEGNKAKFVAAGVTNTFQVIGKFMMLYGEELTTQQHCDLFWTWLKEDVKIPASMCSAITLCIAKKADNMMPGLFKDAECVLRDD